MTAAVSSLLIVTVLPATAMTTEPAGMFAPLSCMATANLVASPTVSVLAPTALAAVVGQTEAKFRVLVPATAGTVPVGSEVTAEPPRSMRRLLTVPAPV